MPRDKEPAGFIGKPDQHSAAIARIGTQVGWLEKQSDFAKKWNRRFCVLRPCTLLYYYENEGDDKPKGVIDLENYHFVQSCGDDDRPHSFTVGAYSPFGPKARAGLTSLFAFVPCRLLGMRRRVRARHCHSSSSTRTAKKRRQLG